MMDHQPLTPTNQSGQQLETLPQPTASVQSPQRRHPLRRLQRGAGNQAAQRLVQAKLAVNPPGDPYEEEADRVADQVLGQRSTVRPQPPTITPIAAAPVRRCACGGLIGPDGECETCRRKRLALQGKGLDAQPHPAALQQVETVLAQGGGRPLDPPLRRQFETQFDQDFSGVRVHTHGRAASTAQTLRARAYTAGQDIVFAPGEYAPETAVGQRLLAHELTHTIQQANQTYSLIQRANGDGSENVSHDEPINASYSEEEQVCMPEEPGVCELQESVEIINEDKPPPKPGEEQVSFTSSFGTYILSPDNEYLRYILTQIIAKGGWSGTTLFIYELSQKQNTLHGPSATAEGRKTVDKILPILQSQTTELKEKINAFGANVRAAAYTRLEGNRKNLLLWDDYVSQLTAEQIVSDLFVQEAGTLWNQTVHSKLRGPTTPEQEFESWSLSPSAPMRRHHERMIKGEICSGGGMCHSQNLARNQEYAWPTTGLSAIPPAFRAQEYRFQEMLNPAPSPDFAQPSDFSGVPDWQWQHVSGPGTREVLQALNTIAPKLTALGDSGYRIIDISVVNGQKTALEIDHYVHAKIEERRQDYAKLMKRLEDGSFDFYELGPIIELLLPAAPQEVRVMVPGIMRERARQKQASAIAEFFATIGVILLTIFPPTAPLGIALSIGMGAYGLYTGYEDLQRGKMYEEGRGSGLFTREQEDQAQMLQFMGTLNMALFALDIADLGKLVRVTRITRSLDEAAQITRLEAIAGERAITVSRNGDGPLTVTITLKGEAPITRTLDELAAQSDLLGKRGLSAQDIDFLRTTNIPSKSLSPEQLAQEFDVVKRMSGGKNVSEIQLPNGHTWKRSPEGQWCRHSNDPLCWWLPELAEIADPSVVRVKGVSTVEDVARFRKDALSKPPGVRSDADWLDWVDYQFYAERRMRMIEDALNKGHKTPDLPRTFDSFRQAYPPGHVIRNEISGTRFELRTASVLSEELGEETARKWMSQPHISESLSPTRAPGELTRPDFLVPRADAPGLTAISNKSRQSFINMSETSARTRAIRDLEDAIDSYSGLRSIRRAEGASEEVTRIWLLYDAAKVPKNLRPAIEAEARAMEKMYEGQLKLEVGFL